MSLWGCSYLVVPEPNVLSNPPGVAWKTSDPVIVLLVLSVPAVVVGISSEARSPQIWRFFRTVGITSSVRKIRLVVVPDILAVREQTDERAQHTRQQSFRAFRHFHLPVLRHTGVGFLTVNKPLGPPRQRNSVPDHIIGSFRFQSVSIRVVNLENWEKTGFSRLITRGAWELARTIAGSLLTSTSERCGSPP